MHDLIMKLRTENTNQKKELRTRFGVYYRQLLALLDEIFGIHSVFIGLSFCGLRDESASISFHNSREAGSARDCFAADSHGT